MRTAALLLIAGTSVAATGVSQASAAVLPTCKDIIVSKYFDNDQTGGWWAVTTSMGCTDSTVYKIYNLEVINTTTNRTYYRQSLTTKATSYVRTVTVPSVPRSRPEYACVIASEEVKLPYGAHKEKNVCFSIVSPF